MPNIINNLQVSNLSKRLRAPQVPFVGVFETAALRHGNGCVDNCVVSFMVDPILLEA